ncbi:MAG: hypothetical protein HGB17_15545 [Syntrophobacteraceae bacterium]|nr:hypothetical protein [Syntrophobacteraceae bacterium]
MERITFEAPNSNRYPGSKDLKLLNMQFISTLYEPQRVEYGPNFTLELKDDHCKSGSDRLICEIGFLDGYITSPYKKTNYLYSSPWTFDSGLNLAKDFLEPLANDAMPSPAGGFYRLGTSTSKLISDYANISNRGVPYGYPYLVKDPQLGVVSHMLRDIRNPQGEPLYAPIGCVV